MMPRFVSIWLPYWPTDRLRRAAPTLDRRPLALITPSTGGLHVYAVDAAAAALGLGPGMTLADARALVPELLAADADAAADAAALAALAAWCTRYSPWTAPDDPDGIVLDISGAAHLLGGEAPLLDHLLARLRGFGLHAAAAIADTPAAAWAMARHGGGIIPPGQGRAALAPLPAAALRVTAADAAALRQLGLRRIGELYAMPRRALARRFDTHLLRRLDQALGLEAEPISPLAPVAPWRFRLAFAEPIAGAEAIAHASRRLLETLCAALAAKHRGVRRLECAFYRTDGGLQQFAIGASQPSRAPGHLARLLAERLATIDAGFGIEEIIFAVAASDRLEPSQLALTPTPKSADDLGELIDRLAARLGPQRVLRLQAHDSHIPERAAALVPVGAALMERGYPAALARPICLLPCPEPVETEAAAATPAWFRWRRVLHRVASASGPERIAPEWWRSSPPASLLAATRDYWRVEDEQGRRFWLYRAAAPGGAPGWYLHGLFA
jgi:protein ImuB